METEDKLSKAVTACLFRAYSGVLASILNILGTDDTVSMLRASADALEAAKPAIEARRTQGARVAS